MIYLDRNIRIFTFALEDGTICAIYDGYRSGGISCNWEAKGEAGCSAEETEEMEYGEPQEDHNIPFILQ